MLTKKKKTRSEILAEKREVFRAKRYLIRKHQLLKLIEEQGNLCKVCKKPGDQSSYKKLHIDHCHVTGIIRGLLCNRCNSILGKMESKGVLTEEMALYVQHSLEHPPVKQSKISRLFLATLAV